MATKHFIIYYQKESGTFVVTEPRPWAKENQNCFPNFTFQGKDHPTTEEIEDWLVKNKNFQRMLKNSSISLVQNLDQSLAFKV